MLSVYKEVPRVRIRRYFFVKVFQKIDDKSWCGEHVTT